MGRTSLILGVPVQTIIYGWGIRARPINIDKPYPHPRRADNQGVGDKKIELRLDRP